MAVPATLPVAALIAAAMGLALGAVVFRVKRVRGELFALATLAFTFVVGTIVLNTPIDGGPGIVACQRGGAQARTVGAGHVLPACARPRGADRGPRATSIARAKLGTGLFAIHDDEDVAEVHGRPDVSLQARPRSRSSCALAGVAGGIQALFVSYVTVSETFSITVPLSVVLMSVLGGTRHWAGPAVGATVITGVALRVHDRRSRACSARRCSARC